MECTAQFFGEISVQRREIAWWDQKQTDTNEAIHVLALGRFAKKWYDVSGYSTTVFGGKPVL